MALMKSFGYSILISILQFYDLIVCTQNGSKGVSLNSFIDKSQEFRQQLIRDMEMDPGQLPDIVDSFQLDPANASKLQLNLTNGIMYGFSKSTRYGDYIAKFERALKITGTTRTPLLTTSFKYKASGPGINDHGTFNVTFQNIVVDFAVEFDFRALKMKDTQAKTIRIGQSDAIMASDSPSNQISEWIVEKIIKPYYIAKILKTTDKMVVQLLERSPSKIFEKFWRRLVNEAIPNFIRALQSIVS